MQINGDLQSLLSQLFVLHLLSRSRAAHQVGAVCCTARGNSASRSQMGHVAVLPPARGQPARAPQTWPQPQRQGNLVDSTTPLPTRPSKTRPSSSSQAEAAAALTSPARSGRSRALGAERSAHHFLPFLPTLPPHHRATARAARAPDGSTTPRAAPVGTAGICWQPAADGGTSAGAAQTAPASHPTHRGKGCRPAVPTGCRNPFI